MLKIVAKFENGEEIELREIRGLGKDCEIIIVKVSSMIHPEDIEELEKSLSNKLNRKVVALDGRCHGIVGVI